jgi:hypothetical protein
MGESGPEKSSEAAVQPSGSSAAVTPHPVFISYASQNAAVANSIVESLESQGLKSWIAPRDVASKAAFANRLYEEAGRFAPAVGLMRLRALLRRHPDFKAEPDNI